MGLETALFAIQGLQAIKGFADQRKAAKETKRANRAAKAQAQREAQKLREDSAKAELEELRDAKRIKSAQLASFLSSGVSIDGSPLLVLSETDNTANRNVENIRRNTEADVESILYNAEANKQPVQKADIFGTTATLLGVGKGLKDDYEKRKAEGN